MNLTEASDVTQVLRAYCTPDGASKPAVAEAGYEAALRLAKRLDHQLSASGRPRVTVQEIRAAHDTEGPVPDEDGCGGELLPGQDLTYTCTRRRGHHGEHIAHDSSGQALSRWEQT